MNCIVIDDEPIARQGMMNLINRCEQLQLKAMFRNAEEAAGLLKDTQVDLIFLDIQMPGTNGLHFARTLPENTMIIFTTAHAKHALESYEMNTVDYLTKPISEERFVQAVEKAGRICQVQQQPAKQTLPARGLVIRADRRFNNVLYQDILYVEGMKDYVRLHLVRGKKMITAMNLKAIQGKLPEEIFSRISKSFIVNKRHITSKNNRCIYLKDIRLPLGEAFREQFLNDCSGDPLYAE